MTQTAVTAAAYSVSDLPGGERNLIGLARVSTDGQDAQLQRDALAAGGCGRIYKEKISTRKATGDRPGLTAALAELRGGDTLVVWKLDRLGRSVKDVLTIADDLHARGVGVKILTGKLSGTYSPTGEGKFFFTMMAAFAELERDIIHERTMAVLAAARAQRAQRRTADRDGRRQARRRRGSPCSRREPYRDRQGAQCQQGIGLPAPERRRREDLIMGIIVTDGSYIPPPRGTSPSTWATAPGWRVSWLPDRTLTRNEALTAMRLAEAIDSGLERGNQRWPHIESWAAELGMSSAAAIIRVGTVGWPES